MPTEKKSTKNRKPEKSALNELKKIGKVAIEHASFIAVLFILATLAYNIVVIRDIQNRTNSNDIDTSKTKSDIPSASSFDKKTISNINNLNNRQQSANVSLPDGRINPFSE